MKTTIEHAPTPEQVETLVTLIDPVAAHDNRDSRACCALGPEVFDEVLVASEGLLAVSRKVSLLCSRIDDRGSANKHMRGDHRYALKDLQIREYFTAYDDSRERSRFAQRFRFRWDEQAVYYAERDVLFGGAQTRGTLERELEKLDAFDPYVEFDEKPIFQSFHEVTKRDVAELIADMQEYFAVSKEISGRS